jgi:hypothetical protein
MRTGCFDDYARSDYRCHLCYKSMADMHSYNSALDKIMLEELDDRPESQMNTKVRIFCNDCGPKRGIILNFSSATPIVDQQELLGPVIADNTRFYRILQVRV